MKDIFTEILEAIEKESRQGYGDYAVFGGFYVFVEAKLSKIAHSEVAVILALLRNYATACLSDRKQILATVAGKIEKLKADLGEVWESQEKKSETPPGIVAPSPPLQYVKSVGPKRVKLLKKLGISDVYDLLHYYPKRHEDRRTVTPIAGLISGENAVIRGTVQQTESYRLKKNLEIFKVRIADDTAAITGVWFNQGWLKDKIKPGLEIVAYGRSDFRHGKPQFQVAEFDEVAQKEGFGILPIYGLTEGLNQKLMRTIIKSALKMWAGKCPDIFPPAFREEYGLSSSQWAGEQYHFPQSLTALKEARKRVVFDEFFLLQLGYSLGKGEEIQGGISQTRGEIEGFQALVPFPLTGAQIRVIGEIYGDMANNTRMLRLLEGDVGSGKTLVAAAAIYRTWQSGHQCALMAPTEILALQHYQSLVAFFEKTTLKLRVLTGSTPAKEKKEIYDEAARGKLDLLIGTHALVEKKTIFKDLTTVIIDEQHRFGVSQREKLAAKGVTPDTLILTATPIPRTLAMTVFADLSLSVLDEMPPGRKEVKTYVLTPKEEERALNFIAKQSRSGYQAYIVCPLVAESETLDLAAATDLYHRLSGSAFKDIRVGLVHGKMKAAEKNEIMAKFRANEISVLIATTVIEVGVNVPNATVMLIRDAQRFGLAQLHQIRGRIGRGEREGYCILEYGGGNETAKKRLEIMRQYQDGFRIAEEDLALRGPGDFFGTRQHGLVGLQVADLYIDHEILALAAQAVKKLLQENPALAGEEWQYLRLWLKEHRLMI